MTTPLLLNLLSSAIMRDHSNYREEESTSPNYDDQDGNDATAFGIRNIQIMGVNNDDASILNNSVFDWGSLPGGNARRMSSNDGSHSRGVSTLTSAQGRTTEGEYLVL